MRSTITKEKTEDWGPARYLKLGHRPSDTFIVRQAKSIVLLILIIFSVAATVFFFDPNRSAFIHFIDAIVILTCGTTASVLYWTKNIHYAFNVIASAGLTLIVVFLLVVGNRGADLMLPLFFPLMAVITVGPQQSRIWIVVYVLVLLATYTFDQNAPRVEFQVMQSTENPTGSVFYSPEKQPLTLSALVTAVIGAIMSYLMVYFAYAQLIVSRNTIAQQRQALAESYRKSEELLRNILPESVADRLKENPATRIADDLDDVAILIADLVNFTEISASKPAAEVVEMLNRIFSAFDALVSKHGLEKIKTSGDAYMVAAGLSSASQSDLEKMAQLALEMVAAAKRIGAEQGTEIAVRVGLHSGLATAGIVGTLKFYYDIWGDTVNLAARLQSAATPNSIRVSELVYRALRNNFKFEEMPISALKGKGRVVTYVLVSKLRP